MRQLWLIEPSTESELTITSDLDSHTHRDLLTLMAAAIEVMHLQQANSHQRAKEASTDESITAASQD